MVWSSAGTDCSIADERGVTGRSRVQDLSSQARPARIVPSPRGRCGGRYRLPPALSAFAEIFVHRLDVVVPFGIRQRGRLTASRGTPRSEGFPLVLRLAGFDQARLPILGCGALRILLARDHRRARCIADDGFQDIRSTAGPLSFPGQNDEIGGLLGGHAHYLRSRAAASQMHMHAQVASGGVTGEALDELAGPSGPFMLRLVQIVRRGEGTRLNRAAVPVAATKTTSSSAPACLASSAAVATAALTPGVPYAAETRRKRQPSSLCSGETRTTGQEVPRSTPRAVVPRIASVVVTPYGCTSRSGARSSPSQRQGFRQPAGRLGRPGLSGGAYAGLSPSRSTRALGWRTRVR